MGVNKIILPEASASDRPAHSGVALADINQQATHVRPISERMTVSVADATSALSQGAEIWIARVPCPLHPWKRT